MPCGTNSAAGTFAVSAFIFVSTTGQTTMPYGKIMRWNDDRGYGFISNDQEPHAKWRFVHISELPDRVAPYEGDAFEYGIAMGRDGRENAVDLVPMTPAHEEADRVFGS
jgi:cold shock CspA family protein